MAASVASAPVQISCKGILFDMDGVLIASLGSVERSWTKWANLRGIDPEYAVRIAHGCRSIETVAKLRPDLDPETENQIIEGFEIDDVDGLTVLPGVLNLLSVLPRGRWTVVTSATEPLARVRLNTVGIRVPEQIVTAESVTQGKPHPQPYRAGAALLGLAPEHCLVFEDSASGVRAGRAAGCTVIATTFSHSIEDLSDANYLVTDMTGIKAESLSDDKGIALSFTPLVS
jgi:mannitol-1-/sugar-/sorbitol-6-phosphatase